MKAIVFICLLIFSQSHCVEDVTETTAVESTTGTPTDDPEHDMFETVYNIVISCSEKEDLLLSSNCIADALLVLGAQYMEKKVTPYVNRLEDATQHHFGTAENLAKFAGEILDIIKQNLPDYFNLVFSLAKDTAKEQLQQFSHKVLYQLFSHFGLAPVKIPVE